MRNAVVLLVAILSAACTAPPATPAASARNAALAADFDLPIGERVGIDGTRLSVKFERVVEESRCPMNARCIWEGNAKLAIVVSGQTLELNTSERFAKRQSAGNYDIVLVHLEPTPMTGETVEKYIATLRVEARP